MTSPVAAFLNDPAAQEPFSEHPVTPGDIAVGVVVGRASEYFDFFVYGLASVLVFPALFFPQLQAPPDPQAVEVVSPKLHHLATLRQELGAVVGAAERVLDGVGELRLDDVGVHAETFFQHGARHRAETVGRQFALRVDAHALCDSGEHLQWRVAGTRAKAGCRAINA